MSLKSGDVDITALVDSGANITVIRQPLLLDYEAAGSTTELTSEFGDRVTVELPYQPLSAITEGPYATLQPRHKSRLQQVPSLGIFCSQLVRRWHDEHRDDAFLMPSDLSH